MREGCWNRLDLNFFLVMKYDIVAGPPPDAELPQKPFGLVDISQQELNVSEFLE